MPFNIPFIQKRFLAHHTGASTARCFTFTFLVQLWVPVQGLLRTKRFLAQVTGVVTRIWLQRFLTGITMFVQVKLFGCFVVTQATNMHWEIGFDWFHMHSFLVSSQIAIRCRKINALDPIRFDVTVESFLYNKCWNCVVSQLLFTLERFVTQIARRLNFSVDITIVVIEIGFNWKKLTTNVADKFWAHFSEICGVFVLTALAGSHRLTLISWTNLVLRHRKIADKLGTKILLILLFYFGQK